ncbi:MAG: CRISPR-associated endonuclease Cas4g/Cas1g, partial [Planctomycetota bacterium]
PVRAVSEYAYCPRLFHLVHVEGRWADNAYTVEGRNLHAAAEKLDHVLPDAETAPSEEAAESEKGDEPPTITKSVCLGSERLGIIAKLDLVATDGDDAVPVETKRGRVPKNEQRSWEPERIQLMAQGLLLREHGYRCDRGVLYYAGSRTRVDVPFDPDLESRTLAVIDAARVAEQAAELPPPLEDSSRCPGCSLCGICLPDETALLKRVPPDPTAPATRRLYPARDDAVPLYVQEQGALVAKSGEALIVKKDGVELTRVRLKDMSQLVVCGNVSITPQAVHLLCEASVPIVHLSYGFWFYGMTNGITLRNSFDRVAQYDAARSPERCLALAKALVAAKIANQRTLLRRNAPECPQASLDELSAVLDRVDRAEDVGALLGLEGTAAAVYFSRFGDMLRPRDIDAAWSFTQRNRRPPRDPVNALLSFGYALLAKECTVALLSEGLDPWWGLFHRPRHGRPALALDLMEEFRPLVADSAVLTAINTGMVTRPDFEISASGCALKPNGRKAFLRAYEARLDQFATHPVFDYRCSWRALVRLQARLLARWLRGDIPRYTGITTR